MFRSLLFLAVFHSVATALAAPMRVLVTGAAGKTGRLVMQKLNERPAFTPIGVVRTEESRSTLMHEKGFDESMLVLVADICDAKSIQAACRNDIDAMIICTSATPAPTGEMSPEGRPVFGFPNGQPVEVDWMGQKNQIDAGKQANTVKHIVVCSSMGGTNPENPLNKIGLSDDDNKAGNILLWKRKAEKYLVDSGISYTIVHPGGLLDEAGGLRELVVGINDGQLETENRSIPRADVAELLVSSLEHESYKNRSFDARSKPEGDGTVTKDFDKLLKDLKGNSDYSLGLIP